jgi:Nucleotidyl transferase AbiEii toxin, Type IV TA system
MGSSMDFDVIKELLAALEREGVRYAVFGGVAMGLHGLARFTEDLDLFIEPESENVARLRAALHSVVDDPEIDQITAADLMGDYPAIQYVPPGGGFHIDIVTRLGDAISFASLEIRRVEFDGLPVSVVTPRGLYAMKRDTVRLKDRADAQALRQRFGLVDEESR